MPSTAFSSGQQDALAAGVLYLALYLQATFKTETVYLWTGYGNNTWGGNTYIGVGTLGGVTAVEEGSTVNARNVTFTLSGIDSKFLSDVINEFQLGAAFILYLGIFTPDGVMIDLPVPIYVGRADQPTIDVAGTDAAISISTETRLIDMNTVANRRYTNDDQQLDHPGDLAFEFVYSIQMMTIYFGATPNSTNNV